MRKTLPAGAVVGLLVLAAAPYLRVDGVRLGILLTYVPRPLVALAAAVVAGILAARRSWPGASGAAVAAILSVAATGWSSAGRGLPVSERMRAAHPGTVVRTLIAANIHNSPRAVTALRDLATREDADVLVLQEVRLNRREEVRQAFGEFRFLAFDPPKGKRPASSGVYAAFTGVRRSILDDPSAVSVFPAITDYRTFAIETRIGGRPLRIVNVHATKPLWTENGWLTAIVRANWSSRWHLSEARRLAEWINAHGGVPLIAAGDFNAPHYAWVVRTLGLREAHAVAGHGPHLTWPSLLPLMDLDHVLGGADVEFLEYRTSKLPGSDHLAQIVRFVTGQDRSTPVGTLGE